MTAAPPTHPAIAGDAPWERATRKYIDLLRAHYSDRLHAVVLFGSRARGDAVERESDVDLLVVLNGEFDFHKEQRTISDLAHSLDESFGHSLLFGIVATVYEYRKQMLPLYMNVRREGIGLWPYKEQQVREERGEYGRASEEDIASIVDKAREAFQHARLAHEAQMPALTANRAYYTIFHATTALLLSDGLAFSRHQGVISGFHEHFIKSGRLPRELGNAIERAFEARNIADYSYKRDITPREAEELVRLAAEFLAASEQYLDLKP